MSPGSSRIRSLEPAALVGLWAAAAAGCAASGFVAPARAGNAADVGAALAVSKTPIGGPINATGRPLAVLAISGRDGARLVAFDLAGRQALWTQPADLTGRAVVGRSVIVATEKGGSLVARDVTTGQVRWQDPAAAGGRRIGYAVDGDDVYSVMQRPGRSRGGEAELVAFDGASGRVRWRREFPTANVGAPAARGGLIAVPMRSQYVTLVNGASGKVLADILSREEAATFVRALPEGIFFGSKGIFLVDPETSMGSRKGAGYVQAVLPKFVRPLYHFDLYRPEHSDYSATDRNRILWRVEVERPRARFAGGMVFVHHFRFFFGFDAATGALRWAYNHPRVEGVSSEHTGKAILFATADGQIAALDAGTGRPIYGAAADVGTGTVRGVTFDADGFALAGGAGRGTATLAATLASIVWDPDRRFTDVKVFSVDELARLPGREVTGELLKALTKEGIVPAIQARAADALVARQDRSAVDLYVKALEQHTDFVSDYKGQGLEVLARAVGAMQARDAAPALAAILRQPDTSPRLVIEVAEALVKMGARDALSPLRDFLLQYRADPGFVGDPAPLVAVAEAMLKLGGAAEREVLLFVAEEGKTLEALRLHVRRALMQTGGGRTGPTVGAPAPGAPSSQ